MEKILIDWIRKNPAQFEDSDDSYHNREQMMKFANYYHKKQLKLCEVSHRRELFYNFITWYNAKPNKNKEKMIYTDTIEEYLKL